MKTVKSSDINIFFEYPSRDEEGNLKTQTVSLDPVELDVHLHQAFKIKKDDEDPSWIIDFRNRLKAAYDIPFTSQDALALVDAINEILEPLKKTADDMPLFPQPME
jgi:hypothetical protein